MSESGKRLVSGIIGIILLIIVVMKGDLLLSPSIFIISIIGLREFYNAVKKVNLVPYEAIGILGATIIFIADIIPTLERDFVITFITLILLISMIFIKKINLASIGITLLGVIYIPFLLFHISYLNSSLNGSKYIWLIFLIAFGTDTFAYFSGNMFGKHKLCPTISPNKTIEGSIGGIIGSLIITTIYAIFMNIDPLWKILIMSVLTSIISQFGDLVASRIKRITGIKDYGKLIPGHGGIIDRFDSIIFVAPVIYYFVRYFL